tara:strand:+ start:116 stop:370 length:255 start_codon:yes stop_codon:yes gene_type:complete
MKSNQKTPKFLPPIVESLDNEQKRLIESIKILERDNKSLRKQQLKYRNVVNGHMMDKKDLQDEIDRLIDENVKLVDEIKKLRIK